MLTTKALQNEQPVSFYISGDTARGKKPDEPSPDAQIASQKGVIANKIGAAENKQAKENDKAVLSWYRFVAIAMYFLIKFTSGATYGLYIPYSNYLQEIYGIRHVYVVITAYAFQCLSPFVNILYANRIILYAGTKISVKLFA